MSQVILLPHAAAEAVCHEEQLRIWAHDDLVYGDPYYVFHDELKEPTP